tara:strand:+ start:1714 stop:1899 length:186 start_codon:yes stop_codon:yes gene_type:complete
MVDEKLYLTTWKITDEDGNEKVFPGPMLYAHDFDEANREAKILKIEIVGEFDLDTMKKILH